MYFAPTSLRRAAAAIPATAPCTSYSPVAYEQKPPAATSHASTEHQLSKIDIDLSGVSDDGDVDVDVDVDVDMDMDMDMDMNIPELEVEESGDTGTDTTHYLHVAQDQNGIPSTSKSTSISDLRTTAEVGVQSNYNYVFKVSPRIA